MAAISETLRQARLRSGVDLDKLAAKTKINPRYLEAIETGNFDKLPGGIFARMFIKQYADAVGLDGASFAEEFQRSSQFGSYSGGDTGTFAPSRASFHPSVPGFASGGDRARGDRLTSMLSSIIWVVAAIGVCAAAYYGLAHLPSRTVVTPPAETAVAPKPAKSPEPVTSPDAKSAASSGGTQAGAQKPPESASGAPSTPAPNPASTTASPTSAATAPAPTDASAAIQLSISATEPVWVTAVADGKTVVSEIMQPGSNKIISAAKGARVTLGNAGGADITFNGKKLEPFGPKGQVRTIDFSSFGAQVVSRTPPNPDPLR